MKEYLELFTDVKEALPTDEEVKYCIGLNGKPYFAFYVKETNRWMKYDDSDPYASVTVILVKYWLDLSKLTTKEKAIEALKEVNAHCENCWPEDLEPIISKL